MASFECNISTLGGKHMQLLARDDWSGWDVKVAVQKAWQVQPKKQRLVFGTGVQLQEGQMLSDIGKVGERLQLSLVVLQKTQEEMDWERRWKELTPEWLQRASERILTNADFESMLSEKMEERMARVAEVERPRELSCDEFLRVMRTKPHLLCTAWSRWSVGMDTVKEKVAKEAMARDPEAVLPHLGSSPWWAGELVSSRAGVFHLMPQSCQESVGFLYPALEVDAELRAEFLETATKAEVNAWRWARAEHLDSKPRKRRSR